MVVVYWSWNCESCPEIKCFSLFLRTALLFQLISARGRKLVAVCISSPSFQISTYLRKGTETTFLRHQCCYKRHFNLSPQGDGNVAMNPLGWTKLRFQLIPVRGRKHKEDDSGFYFAELFQLIPARGRKRRRNLPVIHNIIHFNLSPQNPLRRCAPALPKGELFQLPLTLY